MANQNDNRGSSGGNFKNDPEKASEAGRKGGQSSSGSSKSGSGSKGGKS